MTLESVAEDIVRRLTQAGYEAYFAGGCVRDFLLGLPFDDIDIATSASPEKVMELFSRTIPVGVSFGAVLVVEGGHTFEVSSFRKDGLYIDGRHPTTIEFATPQEDAQRRDFTINGMFWDPASHRVLDYVGGQEDLRRGVVRAIGDPTHRFREDRLRMIRAVRFKARFRFSLDAATEAAILQQASTLLPAVAVERIWQEFKKMFSFPHFDEALLDLHRLGLLPVIFPALKEVGLEDLSRRLRSFSSFPPDAPLILFLMELFPSSSLEEQDEIALRLKVSHRDREWLVLLRRARDLVGCDAPASGLTPWAHFYALPESQVLLAVIAARYSEEQRTLFLAHHNSRRTFLSPFVHRIVHHEPVVTSQRLLEEGVLPGKQMGDLLREAERLAIDHRLESADTLIDLLKNSPLWPG